MGAIVKKERGGGLLVWPRKRMRDGQKKRGVKGEWGEMWRQREREREREMRDERVE